MPDRLYRKGMKVVHVQGSVPDDKTVEKEKIVKGRIVGAKVFYLIQRSDGEKVCVPSKYVFSYHTKERDGKVTVVK